MTLVATLGPVDLKNVRRDPLLLWMPLLPLLPALLVRWGMPFLAEWLATELAFDVAPLYPLIASFFLLLTPSMAGFVIGFLLIDERDEHTLAALMVTPVPLPNYLFYRLLAPVTLGIAMTLITLPIVGLVAVPWDRLLAATFLGALFAPILALFLVVFAENKVVAFALVKSLNALLMLPVAAYFVPSGWQLLAGVIPTYWAAKVYWVAAAAEPHFWLYWLAGVIVNGAALAFLLRRFERIRLAAL